MIEEKVIIIGAGLSGLYLAYRLKQSGIKAGLIEGRNRLGGRIQTTTKDKAAPIELGATWFGAKHYKLNQLLSDLSIEKFVQRLGDTAIYEPISTSPPQLVKLPPNEDPSFRIAGGTSRLINKLAQSISPENIALETVVKSIVQVGEKLEINTNKINYNADVVISTLPPYLLVKTISFSPALPDLFLQVANQTHTWMGDSIKVALRFEKPFWKTLGKSATIFSNVGPIPEMYEHNDYENKYFALKGFLNGAYHIATKEQRLAKVLEQLKKYYGQAVEDFISYEEKVWAKEALTFAEYEQPILPHQNNGHAVFQKSYFDGKLLLAGSETAVQFPGYMEGAIGSAERVYEELIRRLS